MATDTATMTPAAPEPAPDTTPVAAPAPPASPDKPAGTNAAQGKPDAKSRAKDKTKGEKKGGNGNDKGAKDAVADAGGPNVAAHPRAARAVARAKSWGGLAGFLLGGYLSLPTNTIAGAGLRALVAGVVCYVVVWGGAVFLWRRLVMLELRAREQQLRKS
jgi:hypothetical protein